MNIQKAKEDIIHTIHAYLKKNEFGQYAIPEIRQRPILLMGPPGIGKTQIMEQIARECHIGLVSYTITHHTRQSAVGLPFIQEKTFYGHTYSVTEYTMSEIICSIYQYMERTGKKEGILFIDEINCVSETLAPTMLQFLQCKTFGNQAIPKGWVIVAAGNPPEYNRSVHEFDFVTLDRVRRMDVQADLDVFKSYARSRHLHPFILSYLELRPQNFYKTENDVDGLQFVTARGWEDLSCLITTYEELSIPVDEDLIRQFIQHAEVAKDVAAYYDLYQKYRDHYDIRRILSGQVSSDICARLFHASFDEHFSCVELLLSGLHQYIHAALEEDDITTRAYEFLCDYQKKLSPASREDHLYLTLLQEKEAATEKENTAGLTSPAQRTQQMKLFSLLKSWMPDPALPSKEAFLSVKSSFDRQCQLRTRAIQEAAAVLENAFTFMEEAFGNGQEMVVFITELTMEHDASRFITENGCERYFKYNKMLLTGTRRASLLKEMERDQIYSDPNAYSF